MRAVLLASCVLAGCAASPPVEPLVPALLLGEQHDADEHQTLHRQVIERLADAEQLAAVVIEMAEQGNSTAKLAATADESQVRQALAWKSWPWAAYGPAVMAAVRAGVPVIGANLTREDMRTSMRDERIDALLAPPMLEAQRASVRDGHCGLLPESQIAPMTRVQIARDQAMARAIAAAVRPGKTVVLLAGAGHVGASGVPHHLPASLRSRAQAVVLPPVATGKDYCAELRRQMPPASRPSGS